MIPAIVAGGIALASLYSNYVTNQDKNKRTQEAYDSINDLTNDTNLANVRDINSYKGLLNSTYGGNAAKYNDALANYLKSDTLQTNPYSFVGDVNDYLDPAAQQRADAAMDAIRGDSGDIFSSDYYNRMAAKQQALASDEYAAAWDRMMGDRQQGLNEYSTNTQNSWNNYNAVQQKLKDAVSAYGQDRANLVQGMGDATIAGMNNRTANLQSQANAISGAANAANQESSPLGQLLGPAATFLGSYFGGGS